MSHPHHDLVLHVLHDVLPWLWVVRGGGGDEVTEVSRLYGGGHTPGLYFLQINSRYQLCKLSALELIMNRIIIIEIPHQLMGHWEEETLVCHYDDDVSILTPTQEKSGGELNEHFHHICLIFVAVFNNFTSRYWMI